MFCFPGRNRFPGPVLKECRFENVFKNLRQDVCIVRCSYYRNNVQLMQTYLTELDRDAHELIQLMFLADTGDDEPAEDDASTRSDDDTGEFLRHIADTLRRKCTLAGRTLDRFLAQTQDRSQLGDGARIPDHTPVNFTGSRTSTCNTAMKDVSFHLFNIANFLTNVTARRQLISPTTTTTSPTSVSSTTFSEATWDWQEFGNTTMNLNDTDVARTLPPCACPTPPPPPTAPPIYVAPVLRASDLTPVKRDVRGYLDRSDTVDGCLAGYDKALSKTVEWREATRTAARRLRSDAGHGDVFDFAAEVSEIEEDERNVETLFYRYAYAQVRRRRALSSTSSVLHYLIPPVKVSHNQMVLRPTYTYRIPLAKTSRCGIYCISKKF